MHVLVILHICNKYYIHGSTKFHWGVGEGPENFFSHKPISQRAVWTSLKNQLDPRGPTVARWGSVPAFLRKHIVTCDLPGGVLTPCPPSRSTHVPKSCVLAHVYIRNSLIVCILEMLAACGIVSDKQRETTLDFSPSGYLVSTLELT